MDGARAPQRDREEWVGGVTRWRRERDFDVVIDRAAATNGVDPDLVRGLIGQESGFDPRATGDDGSSFGLMQLQKPTALAVGESGDLFDPATNIRAGTKYLAQQIRRTGDVAAGLSAYNGGYRPALGFGARLSDGTFRNQAYVSRVLANQAYFQSTGQTYVKPIKEDVGSVGVTTAETPAMVDLTGRLGLVVAAVLAVGAGLWVLLHH